MNKSIVRIEKLSHRYSVQWAIRDINIDVTRKGIYGLLGANGAGKSTIMNIMCGVLKQTEGEVFIKGINLQQDAVNAKKKIGFLPQIPPVQAELTVEEFLTYAAELRLMPKDVIPGAVEEVMERCSLTHFKKRLIKNLSGGYKQRVGIAQAIIHKPEFVIFDEPTNGLDPNQILEVRKLIKDIAKERTVILSTHILQEVQALCDYIWMINDGQMIFSGPIQEFDSYITPQCIIVSFGQLPSKEELSIISAIVDVQHLGGIDYVLQYAGDPKQVISTIVQLSVEKGWQLLQITEQKNSLENIFAELSKKRA
ncbi:ABC transporter ATP-binding protein [Sphingobacterium faecale]|uniref:ABC transporter ATP-binding protein n=1 Tax=Sphingobacterium faecale TaxID=2803775 RepID=A0ABS1R4H8_9SPHI|nr:ABC transporter ATP-binding protein [Sphingobacterium faecale]MBL1409180.1 ABC transporter ATP-binding protein [Sphingobacterium faecale]